ncbi:MOSC domain-containing protein [Enhygromyxa salina]|uniref:6-N-hydroxylaminopurine resistance protein n=1 Tax=Enhygromyxa salina TaxID=215803 RepID=A0A2S9YVF5_9BACT|nr:MOSC domain-containing protein [Enhygromyxa salina]PRQ09091.1 6-N-hydroxylaminopurine resistance protein [Enhygromyxa salina]
MKPHLTTVTGLFIGEVEARWPGRKPTAIAKKPVVGPVELTATGLVGDQQGNRKVHGGPEKALHHYPADHLGFWRDRFPEQSPCFVPGCFGENLSTIGMTEANLCQGDILRIGTALVQVSQGRQPCWTLSTHLGLKDLALAVQTTGRTGWYYRVLEVGTIAPGDPVSVQERPLPQWPLARLIPLRFQRHIDPEVARELSELPSLAAGWREAFRKKMSRDYVEDTRPRLGPESPDVPEEG